MERAKKRGHARGKRTESESLICSWAHKGLLTLKSGKKSGGGLFSSLFFFLSLPQLLPTPERVIFMFLTSIISCHSLTGCRFSSYFCYLRIYIFFLFLMLC